MPQSVLNAYSIAPQPGTAGSTLLFDKNGTTYGSAISHTEGTSNFTLKEPGFYQVAFHSVVAPSSSVSKFPVSLFLTLQQNGTPVNGAGTHHTFQSASETSNMSISQVLQVTGPTTLNLMGSGSNFTYSDLGMSVCKLGVG
ncbi:MAG TPA: hypothetical protein H9841_02840 [Candidatus Flavonifractor merdigallinarum]|uniref:Uncharacterized protein n=1 Tax=Candidatus Flavonifractor merdigallinarum TaxID=2838589 RepID=A0A9D2BY25_9FIRM|nr:hypothetical protein [Candidatus Flavonifractor merdigallinarum]